MNIIDTKGEEKPELIKECLCYIFRSLYNILTYIGDEDDPTKYTFTTQSGETFPYMLANLKCLKFCYINL